MLALSQSAVSAALTDLEGQLGVQLFDRVGKRLVVNEHGRLLYPRALALLEQAVEIEQLFREANGAIRIYASSTIGNYILPAVIARYRHDYPQLPIELSVGNSQDVMQAVLDFRVDIGFIEGPCHSTEIISEPWLEDELVVFAAPTSPLARGPVTLEPVSYTHLDVYKRQVAGNQTLDKTLINGLNVCQKLEINVPVYAGMPQPIMRKQIVADNIHGETGLDGPVFESLTRQAESTHAVKYIIDTLMASDGDITLVPVGPLSKDVYKRQLVIRCVCYRAVSWVVR